MRFLAITPPIEYAMIKYGLSPTPALFRSLFIDYAISFKDKLGMFNNKWSLNSYFDSYYIKVMIILI